MPLPAFGATGVPDFDATPIDVDDFALAVWPTLRIGGDVNDLIAGLEATIERQNVGPFPMLWGVQEPPNLPSCLFCRWHRRFTLLAVWQD